MYVGKFQIPLKPTVQCKTNITLHAQHTTTNKQMLASNGFIFNGECQFPLLHNGA